MPSCAASILSREEIVEGAEGAEGAEGVCCAAHTVKEQHEKAAIANADGRQDVMLEPPLRCRPVYLIAARLQGPLPGQPGKPDKPLIRRRWIEEGSHG